MLTGKAASLDLCYDYHADEPTALEVYSGGGVLPMIARAIMKVEVKIRMIIIIFNMMETTFTVFLGLDYT